MIRIGLVGHGFMGKMHAACYAATGAARIISVADANPAQRDEAAAKWGCQTFDSIQALLDGPEVDAVDICTPTYLHEPCVLAAAAAGKHVFCEKPLSLSVESCERMTAAAKAAGVKMMVGHVMRFWPEHQVMKQILDSGRLGKPVWASARRVGPRPTWAWEDWLADPARSGGAVLDLHVHDLDFNAWILGQPDRVFAQGVRTETGALDTVLTTLYAHSGGACSYAEGSLAMPDGYPFTMQLLVVCEQGSLVFDLAGSPSLVVRPAGQPEEHPEIPQPGAGTAGAGGNISSLGGYFNEISYWLQCLREDRQPSVITPDEATQAVRLCLAAAESATTGEIVTL